MISSLCAANGLASTSRAAGVNSSCARGRSASDEWRVTNRCFSSRSINPVALCSFNNSRFATNPLSGLRPKLRGAQATHDAAQLSSRSRSFIPATKAARSSTSPARMQNSSPAHRSPWTRGAWLSFNGESDQSYANDRLVQN